MKKTIVTAHGATPSARKFLEDVSTLSKAIQAAKAQTSEKVSIVFVISDSEDRIALGNLPQRDSAELAAIFIAALDQIVPPSGEGEQ